MTGNTLLTKFKTKLVIALVIIGLLCTSLFFLSACSEDEETAQIPSYSYTDTDEGLISNPGFNFNTSGIKLENYPQTSPTGWSRSKDGAGTSSSAKSGVIDISEEGWKALLNNIYSDTYYVDYLGNKLGFSKKDIEDTAKKDNSEITAAELKTLVVEKFSDKLTAPILKEGATDSKVYMLNNYTSKIGFGASQKITSNKEITINKGEYVKITVDVLTQNIATTDLNGNNVVLGLDGANNEFGASLRLTNSLNNSSQAEYAITNINTNGEWKTYTVYAKADEKFDSKVTLALGLGHSDLYPTEGTVYFDNITVEELETVTTLPVATPLTYGEKDANVVNAGSNTEFFYDMTLAFDPDFNKAIDDTASAQFSNTFALTGDFTKASDGTTTSKDKGWNTSKVENIDANTFKLTDASYSIKVEDPTNFKVSREEYAYVSFNLENKLSKLGSTTITIDVYEGTEKKAAVATYTEPGEYSVGLMIKNNFDKDDTTSGFVDERSFHIVIVAGPTDISSKDKVSDYASGEIKVSNFKIAKGATYQYTDDTNKTETANYKFYQLFTSAANGTTSLHAGYASDFTATSEESTTSVGFGIASTYKEYLNKQLVASSEYDGVETNHIYLTNAEGATSLINTRLTGDANGSYAGVIDTKFANDSTTYPTYNKPSNLPELEDDIRPIMIYNSTADSYGFINNKEAQVIAANSFAKVIVSVKVDATAKAYIYLVDTDTKEVMTFDTFTPNSNGISAIKGEEAVGKPFAFEVANTDGEWIDVEFYIATGKTEKSFRIELWNGSRDGENKSQGYVFYKSALISLSAAFSEAVNFKDTFTTSTSPLYAKENAFTGENGEYLCYSRPLTEIEKQFNEEYADKAVSYSPKVIWAQSDKLIYAIYNTLDVEAIDPYETLTEEDTGEEESGCAAETDPSTFWLSFSSILLAAVLVALIILLLVRNIRRKRKANASDAKSHYTVQSRVRTAPKAKKVVEEKKEEVKEEVIEQPVEETEEVTETAEVSEEIANEETEENKEATLDEYVYGDVQDFGSDAENNKE